MTTMSDMTELVRLAVDSYHGNPTKYSMSESMETLREAAIELNGGSTKLNYKAIRDGQCNGLFTLIEEILSRTVVEGLQGDEYFNTLVDFRNIALGDQNLFVVEDSILFHVDEVAEGTQALRRQRMDGRSEVTMKTSLKAVKIYDELNRILAGQVDFNKMITNVTESFKQRLLNDIYGLWMSATAEDLGGVVYYPAAGSYSEEGLLDLVAHVEAAAGGKSAKILGTKKALRNLAPSIMGVDAANELYHNGYFGSFFGSDVIALPQRHKINSTEFVLDDNVITVIAGDDKPIKVNLQHLPCAA